MDNQQNIITPSNQSPESSPHIDSIPTATPPVKVKHAHRFILGYIALILLVAALAGVYSWQHKKVNSLSTQITGLNVQVSKLNKQVSSSQTTTKQSQATSYQQYLSIQKWGVRIPMPSNVDIGDIYYIIDPGSTNGPSSSAVFGSAKLDALTSGCNLNTSIDGSSGSTPFGWIDQLTPTNYQQELQDSQNTGVTGGTKLGSYYYVWQTPRANCYENEDGNSQFTASLNKITDNNAGPVDNFPQNMSVLLKSIEVIPQT
jgi:outer membrane murein-binding lipoprotein Lpp